MMIIASVLMSLLRGMSEIKISLDRPQAFLLGTCGLSGENAHQGPTFQGGGCLRSQGTPGV